MKSIHKRFLLLFLGCLLPFLALAQQAADTVRQDVQEVQNASEEERVPFSWKPTALRLGVDVSRLAVSLIEEESRFFELNSDLQFGRYFLAADWGRGRQLRMTDSLDYSSQGSYFRLGADVNLIPENTEGNLLFVGLRYARSSYDEELTTVLADPYYGIQPIVLNRQPSARWFEGVAGMKARVWKGLFLGYTLRYKFMLRTKGTDTFASYEVPGFGRVGNGSAFAFNYHLFYRIPF